MAKEFCQNRTFKTKPIRHLPMEYRFAEGSKFLIVDYATTDQLDQCLKMIEDAALRGDNVGVDEYEKDGDSIEMLLGISEIFQASDSASGSIKAFMFIQPCLFQRSYDSCIASVYVFRTKDIDDGVYAELMSLVTDFARDIDTGYTQCVTQVALCLQGIYLQLRKRGFLTVAVFPNWVNIVGDSLKDNAIMVKDFGMPERPLRSNTEVVTMLESHISTDVVDKDAGINGRQITGLPKTFPLKNGAKLVLRSARKNEDELLYEMLTDVVEKGVGYSVHEFPSMKVMRSQYLSNSYFAAIEMEDTKKLIGFLIFRDAAMFRGGKEKVMEGASIIAAESRGKGLGDSFQEMSHYLMSLLGCERILVDTFHTNSQTLKLWKHEGAPVRGVLPRGGFQKGIGWVDLVLCVLQVRPAFARQHKL